MKRRQESHFLVSRLRRSIPRSRLRRSRLCSNVSLLAGYHTSDCHLSNKIHWGKAIFERFWDIEECSDTSWNQIDHARQANFVIEYLIIGTVLLDNVSGQLSCSRSAVVRTNQIGVLCHSCDKACQSNGGTNFSIKQDSQLAGTEPAGYLQRVAEDLNSELKTREKLRYLHSRVLSNQFISKLYYGSRFVTKRA